MEIFDEPAQSATIGGLVARQAGARAGAEAILAVGQSPLTYGGLLEQARRTAGTLRQWGIDRNDRVALVLPGGPDAATAFVSVAAAATCAPLNPGYRAEEFDFYLSDLDAKALILGQGMDSPAVEAARQRGMAVIELSATAVAGVFDLTLISATAIKPSSAAWAEPQDIAMVLHTSGTTSRPKIVPLTHANVTRSAANVARTLALEPADRCLNVMPLFHIHGLIAGVLATLDAGGSVVCTPGFDAMKFSPG